jgi:putative DNA primase/helicase
MITERMQANLLYRFFVQGEDCGNQINLADWRWPWREIFLHAEHEQDTYNGVIIGVTGRGFLRDAVKLVAGNDEEAARIWWATIQDSAEAPHFPTLAEIADTLQPVTWLWPGWIPRGMLSLLGAYQGTGKSYFVLDLVRTVIHGGPWPDGSPQERIGNAIYVEAEAIPQVTNERAQALGIDRHRLWMLMADNGEMLDLTQPRWQDRLLDMATIVEPGLIIIDSLSSISSVGQNSVEDTTRLMLYLVALARHCDCGLLVLHHLRKPPGGQLNLPGMSVHDFRGSGHITAMARTVLGLSVIQNGRQFSLNGPRRLDLVKSNLGPYPDGIGLKLEGDNTSMRFVYGEPVAFEDAPQESTGDKCEEWLLGYLAEHGPSKPAEILSAGKDAGFTRDTIYRTRKALQAMIGNTEKNFRAPGNRWLLCDDAE